MPFGLPVILYKLPMLLTICKLIKNPKMHFFDSGLRGNLYFWRDNSGHEIDCIAEQNGSLISIEIKAGKTVSKDFFKGLTYWSELSGTPPEKACLVYAGETSQVRKEARVMDWRSFVRTLPLEI